MEPISRDPYLRDADLVLYQGDVLEVLRELPSESVDCVVTSPPYWGLRDYGTGGWKGGDPDCEHAKNVSALHSSRLEGAKNTQGHRMEMYRDVCRKCGARRVDQQLGLEPTPDQYVQRIVEVFREVRRVLAAHGTCWVNLGDSYASGNKGGPWDEGRAQFRTGAHLYSEQANRQAVPGLKPKDLVGIPWRVAFALQQDGWWLRSDIIWAKPNPMPESVTDRPTKAHEYVFLLTKQPRYWFDAEAVREPHAPSTLERGHLANPASAKETTYGEGRTRHSPSENGLYISNPAGRNVRSVWTIATQPYPEAHFATYPEELVRRCVLAGCPERVCRICGSTSESTIDQGPNPATDVGGALGELLSHSWRPGVVLDPFVGSGTTCKVARDHGRHSIGIDLSADYLALAARRLQQLSLLSEL